MSEPQFDDVVAPSSQKKQRTKLPVPLMIAIAGVAAATVFATVASLLAGFSKDAKQDTHKADQFQPAGGQPMVTSLSIAPNGHTVTISVPAPKSARPSASQSDAAASGQASGQAGGQADPAAGPAAGPSTPSAPQTTGTPKPSPTDSVSPTTSAVSPSNPPSSGSLPRSEPPSTTVSH
ncbi:hypothetical protein F0L68_32915 [Solihabitans fulvus]|uniref:Uncharacterized protein n=1 Tax=Solihabitans fulvus TaxID=1892852 RepID=A0A5B2WUQ9_9PSEU|nr:hypothetical protein [Solihabitans fulvus]KAA2253607.1 hypothetical protein F0L68_32915 [Solihabitans fulvus]